MRQEPPTTQREHELAANATLMSATDTGSRILYANAAFIEISGYPRESLIGQWHNVVRHPDMPREAFADMWATLQDGDSWTGLVKNRRLDGDHYWVRANVSPVKRHGEVTGYMSVRTRPTRAEVAQAEQLYKRFRDGRHGKLAFHKGLVVRRGWFSWRTVTQTLSTRWRLHLAILLAAAPGLGWAALGSGSGLALTGSLLTMLAASVVAAWWLERQIVRPLNAILEHAASVAAGHPPPPVQMNRVDALGMLMRAVNQAGLNLRSLVDDVGGQLGGMQMASAEISSGNRHLSERTEEAAASLQQTAASMEQLSATVENNAQSAHEAASLARRAREVAALGGEAVNELVVTMQAMADSSGRIAEIIAVIDDIAFQTNILALNAAVESARAGEQGKGFAVVAGEVRTLAQRSAEAAKEIKTLIVASLDKVEAGSSLAAEAGQTMAEIVGQVRHVTDLIGEISVASTQQTAGIRQVGEAVADLDRVTQQNAALVAQCAAASDELKRRTLRLVDAVNVFQHRPGGAPSGQAQAVCGV